MRNYQFAARGKKKCETAAKNVDVSVKNLQGEEEDSAEHLLGFLLTSAYFASKLRGRQQMEGQTVQISLVYQCGEDSAICTNQICGF